MLLATRVGLFARASQLLKQALIICLNCIAVRYDVIAHMQDSFRIRQKHYATAGFGIHVIMLTLAWVGVPLEVLIKLSTSL